jgi:phospholipase A1
VFWVTPVPWNVLGGDAAFVGLGLSHQSNGRSQLFSRSWNRIYATLGWERWRWVFADNPDIEDYMGNFEFNIVYRRNDQEFGTMIRNNLDTDENRGAVQFDWTFPMHRRFRGYVQVFNGYGESLIDYDANITRVGIGILLSDLL